MLKEVVLRDFPNWDYERQLSEYQAYKKMGTYSPFTEADYKLMETVMNNQNAEIAIECNDGVCEIVAEMPDRGEVEWDFQDPTIGRTKISNEQLESTYRENILKKFHGEMYNIFWDNNNSWFLSIEKDSEWLIIGYLKLLPYDKIPNSMQVDAIDIYGPYRGKGLSTFLYRTIKSKKHYTLISDYKQYDNSRKIWTSLAKKDGIKIYDESTNTMSDFIEIKDFNDDKIWGTTHKHKLLVYENLQIGEKSLKTTIEEPEMELNESIPTQEYVDELSTKLTKLAKKHPYRVISDNYKIYEDVFDALEKEYKHDNDFLEAIQDYSGSIDYNIELKGREFTVEIEKSKSNHEKLLDMASSFGIVSIEQLAQYTDDDIEDIDSHTIKQAENILK